MQKLLIIRFGSLGDLCLLGWALQRLAALPGRTEREVTLVTKAAFAPLMAEAEGVDRVVPLESSRFSDLARLADRLRGESWDTVIDAHAVLRSRLLTTLMGRSVQARLDKDTLARLLLLKLRRGSDRLQRNMHHRFEDLLIDLTGGEDLPADVAPPLSAWLADGSAAGPPASLGLAPGAQWDTKRWPAEHFAELLRRFRLVNRQPARIFLGPREDRWFRTSSLAKVAAESTAVEIVAEAPLTEVARKLATCSLLVTNDSGLLHVAEAAGVPVLALFGPTVRQFGYFPCLPGSRVLQRELDCRPCSRNGKRPCHRADLACLNEISIDEVSATLDEMLTPSESVSRKERHERR